MPFLDTFMPLRHLHGIGDIIGSNKVEGIFWAFQVSTETYSYTTESPSEHLPCAFYQALFFIMCSIKLNYLICDRNLFLDKKPPPNPAKSSTMKICLFSEDNQLFLSQGHPIQTNPFPTRLSQTILSPAWAGGWRAEPFKFVLYASDMAVFCPAHKQHPVSGTHRQISKALQVHSPDFCLWYFKGRALWHRSHSCLYFSCFKGQDMKWSFFKPLVLW